MMTARKELEKRTLPNRIPGLPNRPNQKIGKISASTLETKIYLGRWEDLDQLLDPEARNVAVTQNGGQARRLYGELLETSTAKKLRWCKKGSLPDETPDLVLGFGGGTSIDWAKIVSQECNVPWIAMPTKYTPGAVAPMSMSLHKTDGMRSTPLPELVIVDDAVIKNEPLRLLRADYCEMIVPLVGIAEKVLYSLESKKPLDVPKLKKLYAVVDRLLKMPSLSTEEGREEFYRLALESWEERAEAAQNCVNYRRRSRLPKEEQAGAYKFCKCTKCEYIDSAAGTEHPISLGVEKQNQELVHGEGLSASLLLTYAMLTKQEDVMDKMQEIGLEPFSFEYVRTQFSRLGVPTSYRDLGVTPKQVVRALQEAPKQVKCLRGSVLSRYKGLLEPLNELKRLEG